MNPATNRSSYHTSHIPYHPLPSTHSTPSYQPHPTPHSYQPTPVTPLLPAMNRSPYQDDERTVRQPKPIFKARNISEIPTPVGDGMNSEFTPADLSGALKLASNER